MSRLPLLEELESRELFSASVSLVGLGVYRSAPATNKKPTAVVKKTAVKTTSGKTLQATTGGRPTTTAGIIEGSVIDDVNANGQFDPLIDLPNGGGRVFADLNNNGILDVNEPSVTVGPAGTYAFGGLQKGTYTIREVPPIGFAELFPTAKAYRVSLQTGQTLTNRNFFNVPAVTVSGIVFSDVNVNGSHDANEPGISGQTIFEDINNNGVLDPGEPVAITDSRGGYTLTGLAPGPINVRLLIQSNFRPVSPGNGVLNANLPAGSSIVVDFGEVRIF